MQSLRHPNVCLFYGAATRSAEQLALIMEYCPNNNLWSLLQNRNIDLNWDQKIELAMGIAKGVHYLHSFNPPVLHRDLKSLNILLDLYLVPKLADFGWTRKLAEKMTGNVGTFQWMAPEVIINHTYTEKADVYSYGIILWEIASREPPYKKMTAAQVCVEVRDKDLRPDIPANCPQPFISLMKRCWDRNSSNRPSFKEIIHELRTFRSRF